MNNRLIDFRSDTVTRPTPEMLARMSEAPLGDDVWGDDPTVNVLQERVAALAGKEAALLFPTGTQSNLAGLMAQCERGDEYIVGQNAHTYRWEGGGAAVLGSIQPQPIENAIDGTMPTEKVLANIKPIDAHFARTRLIALEDTTGGKVIPRAYIESIREIVIRHGLRYHLDGARAWNSAVAQGLSIAKLCEPFDSISLCFSKGMATPVGSVLVGDRKMIESAHRWRKVLGGGMRQSGLIAAACLYALDNNLQRLADDHRIAAAFAAGLADLPQLANVEVNTNMVFAEFPEHSSRALERYLADRNILCKIAGRSRFVTHRDVDEDCVKTALGHIADFFEKTHSVQTSTDTRSAVY